MGKEGVRNMQQEMYPKGFVIELGDGQYFLKKRKHRIHCASFHKARRFAAQEAAQAYIRRNFGYYGLEAYICKLCWVLASWEEAEYWDGNGFTHDLTGAVLFADIKSATCYRKKQGLDMDACLEYVACRVQKIRPAA